MQTQIIKLNTKKDSVGKFLKKFNQNTNQKDKNNYEVTIIMKKLQNNKISQQQKINNLQQYSNRQDNKPNDNKQTQIIIQKSTKFLLPNITISDNSFSQNSHKSNSSNKSNRSNKSKNKYIKKTSIMNQIISTQSKKIKQNNIKRQNIGIQASDINRVSLSLKEVVDQKNFTKSKRDLRDQSAQSISNDSQAQSLFILENKLNQAIKFLQKDQFYQLQDYLYDFKDKYSTLSDRIQIKWRLLMAHCKQNRKQYQRASINYNQVIEIAQISPKSLSIDIAQVYHRLGICYSQMNQWNQGILAFSKALNGFKKKKNILKYSECMNNLGTLYLSAGSISNAQQCLLTSYYIKQQQFGKDSIKLLSSLLNLYQCNLLTKNYQQAWSMIQVAQLIILKIKDNQLILGGILRRKGKLSFLSGKIKDAEGYYNRGQQILRDKYPYCLQYGQLMNNLALLNVQQKNYQIAKNYIDKASILLNFYYCKQSGTIKTLKNNIDLIGQYLKEQKK